MGAYSGLVNFFDRPLQDYAREYGYHESNILILNGDLNELRNHHREIYNNLLACRHQSDYRTPLIYGQDLVASWIFEDYFLRNMQNDAFDISLSGADRTRMILSNRNVTTDGDFHIHTNQGLEISMELVNDYSNFWYDKQKLHLRDDKYLHLQEEQSLLLAVNLTNRRQIFTLIDFRNEVPATYIPYHKPYDKAAYEITVGRDTFSNFSFQNVQNIISDVLNETNY